MIARLRRLGFRFLGALILTTGLLKMHAMLGESQALGMPDPLVYWMSNRQVMFFAGVLELAAGWIFIGSRPSRIQPLLALWLAALFLAYRWGLYCMDYHGLCPCLGSLTGFVPRIWAETLLQAVIAFLIGIGLTYLIHDLYGSRNAARN